MIETADMGPASTEVCLACDKLGFGSCFHKKHNWFMVKKTQGAAIGVIDLLGREVSVRVCV